MTAREEARAPFGPVRAQWRWAVRMPLSRGARVHPGEVHRECRPWQINTEDRAAVCATHFARVDPTGSVMNDSDDVEPGAMLSIVL